jgi:hypothetical protein
MVADLLTKPLAKDIFKELKYKLLYGFGGDVNNISRHFTPMEQIYKEIGNGGHREKIYMWIMQNIIDSKKLQILKNMMY